MRAERASSACPLPTYLGVSILAIVLVCAHCARCRWRPTIPSPSTTPRCCSRRAGASFRHRPVRPRHALPRRSPPRRSICRSPFRDDRPASRRRAWSGCASAFSAACSERVFGRIVDLVDHISVPRARHRHRRRARPGPDQHVHRHRHRRLGVLCPADARPRCWCRRRTTYVAAARVLGYSTPRILFRHILPERGASRARLLGDGHGAGHPARVEPRLSGPRRAAADRGVGRAGRRRQELLHQAPWIVLFPGFAIVLAGSASASPATGSPTCSRSKR